MKKASAFLLAILAFANSFAQRRTYEPQHRSYDDYMIKSRHLKTAGFVLLGAGAGMIVGGAVLFSQGANEINNINNGYYYDDNSSNSKEVTGAILISAGVLCAVGSIPLLVIGGIMHKKAMRASANLQMQKVPDPRTTGIALQPFPSLALRLNL